MPKVKRSRKPPPDGWELIEPTLDELDQKMREGWLEDDEPEPLSVATQTTTDNNSSRCHYQCVFGLCLLPPAEPLYINY